MTLYCPTCGYNLTGLPENRCPECGEKFDPISLREQLELRRRRMTLREALLRIFWLPGLVWLCYVAFQVHPYIGYVLLLSLPPAALIFVIPNTEELAEAAVFGLYRCFDQKRLARPVRGHIVAAFLLAGAAQFLAMMLGLWPLLTRVSAL